MPMAVDRTSPLSAPLWSGRLVEWGMVGSVLLVCAGVFEHHMREVQGLAERAAVQSTLGALRTALVVDQLEKAVHASRSPVVVSQRNPFLLLKPVPANYAGEFGVLQLEGVAPGSWVFDPACVCIGYRPRYAQGLESPAGAQAAWFAVSGTQGVPQIMARETYVWQGQVVN